MLSKNEQFFRKKTMIFEKKTFTLQSKFLVDVFRCFMANAF